MNTDRAILRGTLAGLKEQKLDLEVKINANVRATKNVLAAFTGKPVMHTNIPEGAVHLNEAADQWKALAEVNLKIEAVEKELE